MGKSRWLWVAFALALAVRVWAFAVGDNGIDFHHNALDRPIFVEGWLERGGLVPDPAYPPVHFYLLAALRVVTTDLVFAPRLLSLLFALAAFWPLVLATRRLFGDRAAAWAGLAYAVFPLGVRVSVVSLAVAPYLFFLAMAIERFSAAWQTTVDRRAALWGAFWLSLAGATRFEGWVLLPVFAAWALWRDRRGGWAVAAALAVFPAAWLAHQWAVTGSPFHFLAVSGGVSLVHMAQFSAVRRLIAWPVIVTFALGPVAMVAAVAGFAPAWVRRRGGWLAAAFGLSMAVFIWRSTQGSFGFNETKYAAGPALLLLPFAGLAVARSLESKAAWRGPLGLLAALALVGAGLLQVQADNVSFKAAADLRATAAWLAEHSAGTPVILGTRDQGYLIVHGRIEPTARRLAQTRDETGLIDADHLKGLLTAAGAKLLVYDRQPDGLDFHPLLQLTNEPDQSVWDAHFSRLAAFGRYEIFRVDPLPGVLH
jgi:Dolichyl-phosphate-mannose-protein mannosyltransferase